MAEPMGSKRPFMPVRLEDQWLLVDASSILEVLGAEPWLAVPQANAFLPGVCAWRGRALAVLDLARLLGLSGSRAEARARTLILETPSGKLAVPVNEARAVFMLDDDRLRPVEATPLPYMSAELDDGDGLTPVLDLRAMVGALTTEQGHGLAAQ